VIVYVDISRVREGALAELKRAIAELADFVAENEPEILAYEVFFSDDGERMTVVHIHAHPASLDHHMDVAGPRFARFADLLTLLEIQVYGKPSEKALRQLRHKAGDLGAGKVVVQDLHAGFSRLAGG
jgi:hypothetical protein